MKKNKKYIIQRIACYDNLLLSIKEVIRGKKRKYNTSKYILNNLLKFCDETRDLLLSGDYKPGPFREFNVIECGKLRNIQSLGLKDRVILHAIMNILGKELFVKSFIRDTYASIKGRGVIDGLNRIRCDLGDSEGTKYCLKIDIKKFYNSIDQNILIEMLEKYIHDDILIKILKNIIHSFPEGLPLGYHSSQYLGNFYLSGFDRFIKSKLRIKYYYRYCDDIVILSKDKNELHNIFNIIKEYIEDKLHLKIKNNYQIFPVDKRGIDFLGYVIRHNKITIRKRIKKKALRKLSRIRSERRIREILSSINGWELHCHYNDKNYTCIIDKIKYNIRNKKMNELDLNILNSKTIKSFSSLGIKQSIPVKIDAIKVSTNDIINVKIILEGIVSDVVTSKYNKENGEPVKKSVITFRYPDNPNTLYKFITSAVLLIEAAETMKKENLFPVLATVKKVTNIDGTGKSYLKFE